ncbi:MAG: CAP domain-containing protein [Ferruginibacter sp.]
MKIAFKFPTAKLIAIFLFFIVTMGCKPAGAQTISPDSIRLILDAHNAWRTELGIPPLTWSADLANYAQQWVNEIVSNRDCQVQHRPQVENDPWEQKFGENIYAGGGTNWIPTVLDAVASWGEEKAGFNIDTKACKDGESCGHFTQLIWRSTKQVGCAVGQCTDGNVIIVCNYDPGGNMLGENPF